MPPESREARDDTLSRMPRITVNVNGRPIEAAYEPGMNFLEVLREELSVLSPKNGCAQKAPAAVAL